MLRHGSLKKWMMTNKVALYYKNLNNYSFLTKEECFSTSPDNTYLLTDYVKKIFKVEFVKKVETYKKFLYMVVCIKLTYGVVFKDQTLYLNKDIVFHPMVERTTKKYLKLANSVIQFDSQLSTLVNCGVEDKKISKQLKLLKEALTELIDEEIVEMDTANSVDFVWEHNAYNPKNVKLKEPVQIWCSLKDKTIIDKRTGEEYSFVNEFNNREFKVAYKQDKKTGADCLKMKYGVHMKNGDTVYAYRDITTKLLTVEMTAKYLEYVNQIIKLNNQISKLLKPSEKGEEITNRLDELKDFLETTEGYSSQDIEYNKKYDRGMKGYAVSQFMLWDEIWGDD